MTSLPLALRARIVPPATEIQALVNVKLPLDPSTGSDDCADGKYGQEVSPELHIGGQYLDGKPRGRKPLQTSSH